METLALKILNMSITGGYVILALLAIRLLLRGAPKRYSYLLWAVVLFRLICPVSFSSLFSIFQVKPFDMTVAQRGSGAALTYVPADIGVMNTPRVTVGIPTMNTIISDSLPAATPFASANPMQIWILLGTILWCIGAATLVTYNVISYIRLKRRMAFAVRLEDNVYESDTIRSPFILGIFRPRIYTPFGLDKQQLGYVLQHERYHLKRKDHWVKLLSLCVLVLHWFNPLIWLAYVLMSKDMEMSCDEKVLSESGVNIAHDYSMSLLSFASNRRLLATSPLAFGETGVRERVRNVLRYKTPTRWAIAFAAAICVVFTVACAANPVQYRVTEENADVHGNHVFEKQIYMSPVSSFLAFDGYKEYYALTEDSLTISNETGDYQRVAIAYEKTTVDEQAFKHEFVMEDFGVPSLSSYQERYQLTDDTGSSGYRLYRMDDELWLVRLHTMNPANSEKRAYIWSIYRIARYDGEMPAEAVTYYGTQEGVEHFVSLQGDFESGYDADTCYNITPDLVRMNSSYQVFKYDESTASFLLYEDETYPLGEWFGGYGVTSMALADINIDGKPELYFTYSWGSGIHRSNAAYFDPATQQVVAFPYAHFDGDMMVADNDAGGLSLYAADVSYARDPLRIRSVKAGHIADITYQNDEISLSQTPPSLSPLSLRFEPFRWEAPILSS